MRMREDPGASKKKKDDQKMLLWEVEARALSVQIQKTQSPRRRRSHVLFSRKLATVYDMWERCYETCEGIKACFNSSLFLAHFLFTTAFLSEPKTSTRKP
jgi:hypothetical protein